MTNMSRGDKLRMWRVANHIHEACQPEFVPVELHAQRYLEILTRKLRVINRRAERRMVCNEHATSFGHICIDFNNYLNALRRTVSERSKIRSAVNYSTSDIYSDLLALNRHHPGRFMVDARTKEVVVTTLPITLEHEGCSVDFGRFELVFQYSYSPMRYTVVPVDNFTGDNIDYPHPHVSRSGMMCLGDLEGSWPGMIQTGQLYNCVLSAFALLNTYNPESPYVDLERFSDDYVDPDLVSCCCCEGRFHIDDSGTCDSCGEYACLECTNGPSLPDNYYSCNSCDSIVACDGCDILRQRDDLSTCESCSYEFCSDCVGNEDLCRNCFAEAEAKRERQEEEAEAEAEAQSVVRDEQQSVVS